MMRFASFCALVKPNSGEPYCQDENRPEHREKKG
jgi:hypothetical protein